MNSKRDIKRRVFILAIFIIICGELFARFYLGLGTPTLSIVHPLIEYMFKPNQDVRRFGNRVLINSYGMRSHEFSENKQDSKDQRILVFGDSVVNGGSLTDQNEIATTIIETKLNKLLGTPVVVGNISAGSWGPGNWLAYAKTYGFFDADIVIIVMSSHDTEDNPTFSPLNPITHPTERPWSALMEGFTRYLPRYLPKNLVKSQNRTPVVEDMNPDPEAVKRGLSDLRELLQLAMRETQNVSVVLWPERLELAVGHPKSGWAQVVGLCNKLDVPCLTLWSAVKEALTAGIDPYRDNIHPNSSGQQIIAKVLLNHLSERYLISR